MYDFASLEIAIVSPYGNPIWKLPPAATATYWTPSTEYVMGGVFTPAPRLNLHSFAPLVASNAECAIACDVDDSVRCVLLTGACRLFCVGAIGAFVARRRQNDR